MANPYCDAGKNRGQQVHRLFAAIAPRYDFMNDLQSLGLHRLWKTRLVKMSQVQAGQKALDICCGTGDVASALARGGARTIGLDYSREMLLCAAHRTEPASGQLSFVQGDAMIMPFATQVFDVVTISYGLRNLPDVTAALEEIQRVTKPGGKLLILDFGKPENPLWRGLYFAYLRWMLPTLGRCCAGNAAAYGYILESLRHYGAQAGVTAALRQTHWTHLQVVNCLGGAMSIHSGQKPPRN
jgi:demethylmenaquinone methyltransferase/2-methoxy-6-polyprenyl-1,4-benzoquinol methylase